MILLILIGVTAASAEVFVNGASLPGKAVYERVQAPIESKELQESTQEMKPVNQLAVPTMETNKNQSTNAQSIFGINTMKKNEERDSPGLTNYVPPRKVNNNRGLGSSNYDDESKNLVVGLRQLNNGNMGQARAEPDFEAIKYANELRRRNDLRRVNFGPYNYLTKEQQLGLATLKSATDKIIGHDTNAFDDFDVSTRDKMSNMAALIWSLTKMPKNAVATRKKVSAKLQLLKEGIMNIYNTGSTLLENTKENVSEIASKMFNDETVFIEYFITFSYMLVQCVSSLATVTPRNIVKCLLLDPDEDKKTSNVSSDSTYRSYFPFGTIPSERIFNERYYYDGMRKL